MSDSSTPSVLTGPYIDYSRSWAARHQWLMSSDRANIVTNVLALLVSIALLRLTKIFLVLTNSVSPREGSKHQSSNGPEWPKEGTTDYIRRAEFEPGSRGYRIILDIISDLANGAVQISSGGSLDEHRRKTLGGLSLGILWLTLYFAYFAASITTARLATNSQALSQHPSCGIYRPMGLNLPASEYYANIPDIGAQYHGVRWALECYGEVKSAICQLFAAPSIPYTVSDHPCPWPAHICHSGDVGGIRFSTGAVDGRSLGINAPVTYQFNRTTICSPLNSNATYIREQKDANGEFTFEYHYGSSKSFGNYTWESYRRNKSFGDTAFYTVETAKYMPDSDSYWTPISELEPPEGAITTIIFIASQDIHYLGRSDDPVFPATHSVPLSDQPNETIYTNPEGPGKAIACLDYNQWRDPTHGDGQWSYLNESLNHYPMDSQTTGGQHLLYAALYLSHMWDVLYSRGGEALDAQVRVFGYKSLPLDAQQWKLEMEKLFRTTLAYIQTTLFRISQGLNGARCEKIDVRAPICDQTFLFNAQGHTNVNLSLSIFVCILCVATIVLSWPKNKEILIVEWLIQKTPIAWMAGRRSKAALHNGMDCVFRES